LSQAHDTKIRTLTYVEYATVADFFCVVFLPRKSLRQNGSNSCGLSQAHDTKIRTLACVKYATVAGGSAASFEGALPLTAIGCENSAYPLLFLRFGSMGWIISFFLQKL